MSTFSDRCHIGEVECGPDSRLECGKTCDSKIECDDERDEWHCKLDMDSPGIRVSFLNLFKYFQRFSFSDTDHPDPEIDNYRKIFIHSLHTLDEHVRHYLRKRLINHDVEYRKKNSHEEL